MNLHMRIKIAFVTESTVAGFALEGSGAEITHFVPIFLNPRTDMRTFL